MDYALLDQVAFNPTIVVSGYPIGDSVELPQFAWTSGGHATWFGQTNITHDDLDAVQSGPIDDRQQSWMETTNVGPGTLSFWWKVSSESGSDYLEFYLNNVRQSGRISGDVNWQKQILSLGAGTNVLRWRYFKDSSGADGQDRGWVDEVAWFPDSGPPQFFDQPISRVVSPGADVEFTAAAAGEKPLFYQWYRNDAALDLQTGLSLWPGSVSTNDAGTYFAVAANAAGSATSAVATLTVALRSLGEALDASELIWATGGDVPWTGQYAYNIAHDGVDAAESTTDYDLLESWMETTVMGPGTVSFWWKLAAWDYNNFVEFYVNDSLRGDIRGQSDWSQLTLDVADGTNVLRWRHINDDNFSYGQAWVDEVDWQAVTVIPLPEAVDATHLLWTTGGDAPWGGRTGVAHDGVDAAQSGSIADNQESSMETMMTGPGIMTFWWKVSSESGSDYLELYRNGVLQSGQISGEVDWKQRNISMLPGTNVFRWRYFKDRIASFGQDRAWVDEVTAQAIPESPLPESVEATQLPWLTSVEAPWAGQASVTHDGVDAAQSGSIADNQESWMETKVVGPGTLSFWWKVSSEEDYDLLQFDISGVEQATISGEVDWEQLNFSIEEGTNVLRWQYFKDDIYSLGQDRAWVDEVTWLPTTLSRPVLSDFVLTAGGEFQFTLEGQLDQAYWIQASSNLVDWVSILTNSSPSGVIPVSDPMVGNHRQRFYRAVTP